MKLDETNETNETTGIEIENLTDELDNTPIETLCYLN